MRVLVYGFSGDWASNMTVYEIILKMLAHLICLFHGLSLHLTIVSVLYALIVSLNFLWENFSFLEIFFLFYVDHFFRSLLNLSPCRWWWFRR